MELILVRHGETVWNREERVQGITDVELSEQGQDQAQKLARVLKGKPIQAIYSSPLLRALETARIINAYHGLPIQVRDELKEMDQGTFEGMSFRELMGREREFLSRWIKDPASITMPGGESLVDVQKRAWPVVESLIARNENCLIVSHNFTIAAILCAILELPLANFRRVSVAPASLTVIRFEDGKGELERINDCRHLE